MIQPTDPKRQSKIAIIEYLRGLASLAVAWFHMTNTYPRGWVNSSGGFGWLGVEAFFVISGFVIPLSISENYHEYNLQKFPNFFLRRIVRIEPTYVFSIVMVICLSYLSTLAPSFRGTNLQISPIQIVAHLSYIIPLTKYSWLQPVYWTLAYEFVFYVLIGIFYSLILGRRCSASWLAASGFVLGAVFNGIISYICILFIIGTAVFRVIIFNDRAAALVIIICESYLMYKGEIGVAAVGGMSAALILFGRGIKFHGPVDWVLSASGSISYSLYLVHIPIGGRIVNLGRRVIVGQNSEFLLSIFALAVSVGVAAALRKYVEQRCISYSRRLLKYYVV